VVVHSVTGRGGLELGGTATVAFVHGSPAADADLVVEWDLDGDGDFSQPEEDVTAYLMSGQSQTGRDFPSQLTGRAGPGQLRLELDNTDSRFSRFNAASPLNQAPFSIRNGGRIRVRTAEAADPDPVLLARDRFRGSGAMGADEMGHTWTQAGPGFVRQQDSTGRGLAVVAAPTTTTTATATVDVGVADYYVQARVRHRTASSTASITYRYDDATNFGRLTLDGNSLILADVVAGVVTTTATVNMESRADVTIGVLVAGTHVTAYLEGVPVADAPSGAHSSASHLVGIRSTWLIQDPVSFDEFHVWSGLGAGPAEGILYTGKVTGVLPRNTPGGPATVTVTAEGPLLDAAKVDVSPPASVGAGPPGHNGMTTGLLVGATLSAAGMLHPPGPIAAGTVTTGPVGLPAGKALDIARLFEETELGFLYETQEGRLGFAGRGDRVGVAPVATFGDGPGAQFGYSGLELGDWRRELFNRVEAGLSPGLAGLHAVFGTSANTAGGVDTNVTFGLPNAANGAVVGDLLIVAIASTVAASGQEWLTPIGWKNFRDAKDFAGRLRIYGKVIEAGDLGATVTFYDDTSTGGAWVNNVFLVKNWFGDIDQGVVVAEPAGVGQPNTFLDARAGVNRPPVLFPPWGPAPSLFLALRAGFFALGSVSTTFSDQVAPDGYGNTAQSAVLGPAKAGSDVALQRATRDACVQVESPSPWQSGASAFGGFEGVEVTEIAIRGFSGNPPPASGGVVVQVDDVASQDDLDTILTHENPARLFASEADARAYAATVLLNHRGERPIFTLTFPASENAAYRNQAKRRRVNDKIALQADGLAGMGVAGEFFIEAIGHQWTDGGKQWWVSWQLSPA
jgi:hypothetical protein